MPKRKKISKSSLDDIDLYSIGNYTSEFGGKAEKYLNIVINETDEFEDIVNHNVSQKDKIIFSEEDVSQELRNLYLEDFNRDAIRLFKPQNNKKLPSNAQTFLIKLKTVVNNNYLQVEPKHVEGYIHDLMNFILKEAKFEDGIDLILMPCILNLQIGNETFAGYADKEGRRGTEIIWVLDEDKHKFDKRYKKGDVQLIANMIAAAQTNKSLLNKIYPKRILGIKFDADCLYFYSSYITESYLNCLTQEYPPDIPIIINKFPKSKPLSLSNYDDRKTLLLYLVALRKYALTLTPFYAE